MELRGVETFLALSEELHFGRTAARLHLSQGRVSQTIQALEREVGAALFERTSRQVRLTALGERFRQGATQGYDELVRTLRECQAAALDTGRRLRVAYAPTIGGEFATRVATAFEAQHAPCTVTLNASTFRETLIPAGALKNGDVDVALVWSPGGDGRAVRAHDLTVGPVLAEVPRGILLPAGHPLAGRLAVSLEDLAGHELVEFPATESSLLRDRWTPRFTPSGRPLTFTADDFTTLTGRTEILVEDVLTLVARGRGLHCTVAPLLERFPFPGLTVVPISDMPPMVIVPVWLTAADNAAVRAFARLAATYRRCFGADQPRPAD
ncbi:LysR family transcriptional regulator [Sphaerisporangium corydalis]|uniref:LysR family transcriptional regulator n=1 Tax=Sphaerisporangium corydalis TaxID=1441875 RepID=A0ABV9EBD7_9ACTN|nr:LysR family transcriptional regulator [Sphaerisporangium corydalis]